MHSVKTNDCPKSSRPGSDGKSVAISIFFFFGQSPETSDRMCVKGQSEYLLQCHGRKKINVHYDIIMNYYCL